MNALHNSLAEMLDNAAMTRKAVPQITIEHPSLTLADAYAIQSLAVHRRQQRGDRRIGIKMGLTSRAKMIQVGVDEMTWGRLTDGMLLEEGGLVSHSAYIHPRIEPELAFLIGKPLSGKVTAAQAMSAVDGVAPAMELIDSRYMNFKFTLNDELVFSGYFNMVGGGVEAIAFLYAPGGAFWFTNSAGPSQGGTTHVEIGQTLIAGDNTFKFNYAGSEGFDDEAWGLENFHVSADIAPAIFPIDDCIETAGVTCDTPGAVPEPVTLGLLSAGLLGMGAMRRRA